MRGMGWLAGQHGDDAHTAGAVRGRDGQVDHWEPTAVVGLGNAARAVRASCGFNHTVVVVEKGEAATRARLGRRDRIERTRRA